jgi:glycosyltransferase involved in cell wall biosynthesis
MGPRLDASVIIPTYQRNEFLLNALQSIVRQKADFDFEVLIIDNGCDRNLRIDVERIAHQVTIPLRYFPVREIGLHNGRHAGTRQAQSDILVFVDDDIIASSGWLQAIRDSFLDPEVNLVGGRNLPRYEEEPPAWLEAFWIRSPDGTSRCGHLSLVDYGEQEHEIDPMLIWGVNFAIRRNILISLGGFHPDGFPWELRRYRGDGESYVTLEAKRVGIKSIYNPKILVYHIVPKNRLTVEYFERRSYLQGISDSYAKLRSDRGLIKTNVPDWKPLLRKVKQLIWKNFQRISPDAFHEVKTRISRAYQAGYIFHQSEVRKDPELLKWVLKEDYWDSRLPEFQ